MKAQNALYLQRILKCELKKVVAISRTLHISVTYLCWIDGSVHAADQPAALDEFKLFDKRPMKSLSPRRKLIGGGLAICRLDSIVAFS